MVSTWTLVAGAVLAQVSAALGVVYEPVREYTGSGFFSEWDYYGDIDNTTWGNVSYADRNTGIRENLTFVEPSTKHAIIRVDNTTDIQVGNMSVYRSSVRITSKDAYPIGSLIVIDAVHIPYGCSVWPTFWTLGTELGWPHTGELVLAKGIKGISTNNMVMHTDPGCVQFSSDESEQGVEALAPDRHSDVECKVEKMRLDSYGERFAKTGGGVFALKLDVEGIFIWSWSRHDIPGSISQAEFHAAIDPSDWGMPSVAYPAAGYDIERFFKPKKLVLDITLCGNWTGNSEAYAQTCPGTCISNIVGNGSKYATAYWEISYIRTFTIKEGTRKRSFGGSPTNGSELLGHPDYPHPTIFQPITASVTTPTSSEQTLDPTPVSGAEPYSIPTSINSSSTTSKSTRQASSLTTDDHPSTPTSLSRTEIEFTAGSTTTMIPSLESFSANTRAIPAVIHTSSYLTSIIPATVEITSGRNTSMINTSVIDHGTSAVSVTAFSIARTSGVELSTTIDATSASQATLSSSTSALLDFVSVTGVHFLVLVPLFLLW